MAEEVVPPQGLKKGRILSMSPLLIKTKQLPSIIGVEPSTSFLVGYHSMLLRKFSRQDAGGKCNPFSKETTVVEVQLYCRNMFVVDVLVLIDRAALASDIKWVV